MKRPNWTIELSHVDTCLGGYLEDHHNREGEALFGITVGVSSDDACAQLLEEIAQDESVPEEVSCDTLEEKARELCKALDFRGFDDAGNRIDGGTFEVEQESQVWILLTWADEDRD